MYHLVIAEYLMNSDRRRKMCAGLLALCVWQQFFLRRILQLPVSFRIRYGHFYDYFESLIDGQYLGVIIFDLFIVQKKLHFNNICCEQFYSIIKFEILKWLAWKIAFSFGISLNAIEAELCLKFASSKFDLAIFDNPWEYHTFLMHIMCCLSK